MPEICPYCEKRPKIKKTCGSKKCQIKQRKDWNRVYWKKFGKLINGKRK